MNPSKRDEIYKEIVKVSSTINTLEGKLTQDAKFKFRNFVGYSKEVMLPGVFADETKAIRNIKNQIQKPRERLS